MAADRGGQNRRAVYHETLPRSVSDRAIVNIEMRHPAECQKCQKGAEWAFDTFVTPSVSAFRELHDLL